MARDGRDEVLRPVAESSRDQSSDRGRFARPAALRLPDTPSREPVDHRGHHYRLTGDEASMLATIGAFRVVPVAELDGRDSFSSARGGAIRQLAEQGLVERKTVVINEQPTAVVVLTRDGQSLLDARQDAGPDGTRQHYHTGLVKARELAHDSQLLRLYETAVVPLEAAGHRIDRVVLDYELKRDYQRFLNRGDRAAGTDGEADMRAFAEARQLPIVDGHLELPDLRIEYETPDGRMEHRDVELVTEHYSRGQLAGKAKAGFALYRATGASGVRGGSARTGGAPLDPHHLEWVS
jgi:hypothetical protein